MSTSPEFVAYLCEQLEGTGAVRSRKMFGEYMVYLNDKPVLLVCDNTPFVKMLPCVAELLRDRPRALPYEGYEGTKLHYVLDPDDRETLRRAVLLLEAVTPVPRKKPPKKKAGDAKTESLVPWDVAWPEHTRPTIHDIAAWVKDPLFLESNSWLCSTYGIQPLMEFSRCSMDRGWNVKYKKGSRPLCVCYVRAGWFTAMVTVGAGQMEELRALLPSFSETFQAIFESTRLFNGGKWLVLDVKQAQQLEDVRQLILLKARPAKAKQ